MKKFAVLFSIIILSLASNAYAKETAVLPVFDVHFNGNKVESTYREYPLLVYKDITYFPMTYFDSRHLGLITDWDGESNTLTISKRNINSILTAYKSENKNTTKNDVSICNFNIIVNRKDIDNKTEPYPLLTFRDVTYFPLTWRFAVDEFGWEYSFDSESGLNINSSNHKVKMLDLSALEMNSYYAGFTCDGEFYYHHNSANGNIYRTPVDDLSKQEVIHHIESGVQAGLGFSDGKVFLNYRSGGATHGTTYQYYINKDKTLTEVTLPYSSSVGASTHYYAYGDGFKADLSFFTGLWDFSYFIGENETEVEIPGVFFGTQGRHSSDEVIPPQIVGDNIYVIGYKGEEEIKTLICINAKSGETSEIASNVDNFEAYDSVTNGQIIIYTRNGSLTQYKADTKEYFELKENSAPLHEVIQLSCVGDALTGENPYWGMLVITKDEYGTYAELYANPWGDVPPPYQGRFALMDFSPDTNFSYSGNYLIAKDNSENPSARLYVFDASSERNIKAPLFVSADKVASLTLLENTLIYRNSETGEFCEVKLKP
ncbi:MAG: hypothetical protein IJX50_01180 [Clostridia bacterium]|nr:hypothetical protein [Clostridia bacterium]